LPLADHGTFFRTTGLFILLRPCVLVRVKKTLL
jgi:hypothetical protein